MNLLRAGLVLTVLAGYDSFASLVIAADLSTRSPAKLRKVQT